MLNSTQLMYAGGVAAVGLFSRVWVKFQQHRRARRSFETPLIDDALLVNVCMPHAKDRDDANVLRELYDVLNHLNRQTYASEFWGLDSELDRYYQRLPAEQRPTLRRALVRMITANDRWLQVVGARSCARLNLREAALPLRGLLDLGDSMRPGDRDVDYGKEAAADSQYYSEIEKALRTLDH